MVSCPLTVRWGGKFGVLRPHWGNKGFNFVIARVFSPSPVPQVFHRIEEMQDSGVGPALWPLLSGVRWSCDSQLDSYSTRLSLYRVRCCHSFNLALLCLPGTAQITIMGMKYFLFPVVFLTRAHPVISTRVLTNPCLLCVLRGLQGPGLTKQDMHTMTSPLSLCPCLRVCAHPA